MKKHINVPVFIPHLGCPNDCVFCNQRTISGHGDYDFAAVKGEPRSCVCNGGRTYSDTDCVFRRSFSGIDRPEMIRLLTLANEYIDAGKCESIRISTRPDYIDEEILKLLKQYRVCTIELGIQSMDDGVLGRLPPRAYGGGYKARVRSYPGVRLRACRTDDGRTSGSE